MKPNTLSGMAAVIAHVPYQLDFHPRDCVVVIGLSGNSVFVTVRVDIAEDLLDWSQADHLVAVLSRTPVDNSIVIGFSDTMVLQPTVHQFADLLARSGMPAHHELLVTVETWRAAHCAFDCCPSQDVPLASPAEVPVIAEEIFRGVAPLANREEVVAQLQRVHPLKPAVVARSLGKAPRQLRTARPVPGTQLSALAEVLVPSETAVSQLNATTIVRACRALQHIDLRDCVAAWVAAEEFGLQLPAETLSAFRSHVQEREWRNATDYPCERGAVTERLLDWMSCVPRAWQPPILTLIAVQQWHATGGVLGTAAAERALQIDPDYVLARLIHRALSSGIRPQTSAASRTA